METYFLRFIFVIFLTYKSTALATTFDGLAENIKNSENQENSNLQSEKDQPRNVSIIGEGLTGSYNWTINSSDLNPPLPSSIDNKTAARQNDEIQSEYHSSKQLDESHSRKFPNIPPPAWYNDPPRWSYTTAMAPSYLWSMKKYKTKSNRRFRKQRGRPTKCLTTLVPPTNNRPSNRPRPTRDPNTNPQRPGWSDNGDNLRILRELIQIPVRALEQMGMSPN